MEQLGEYDSETPLSHRYCRQLTEDEYEDEMMSTTHDALKELMEYVETTPKVYKRIIAKRRLEAEENAGYLSYLRAKLMVAIQGDDYGVGSITEGECQQEVERFQKEICDVFNYSQDSKSRGTRFSRRLEAKKRRQNETLSKEANTTNTSNHKISAPPVLTHSTEGEPSSDESESSLDLVPRGRRSIHSRSPTKKQKRGPAGKKGGAGSAMPMATPPVPPPPPPPPPPPLSHLRGDVGASTLMSPPLTPPLPPPSNPAGVGKTSTLMSPPTAPPPLRQRVLQDSTNKEQYKTPPAILNGRPTVRLAASDGKAMRSKPRADKKHYGSTTSLASIGSIQDELLSFDKKALRSVSVKSPGGTPLPTPRSRRLKSAPVTSPTVNTMFNTRMLDKFKNIRSPPSAHDSPASPFNSTADFTDTP